MAEGKQFELPKDVGDCYLLIGYPFHECATLAFAYQGQGDTHYKWKWWVCADDGDQYPFSSVQEAYEETSADEIRLVRRVREGLADFIPEEFKKEALRYG